MEELRCFNFSCYIFLLWKRKKLRHDFWEKLKPIAPPTQFEVDNERVFVGLQMNLPYIYIVFTSHNVFRVCTSTSKKGTLPAGTTYSFSPPLYLFFIFTTFLILTFVGYFWTNLPLIWEMSIILALALFQSTQWKIWETALWINQNYYGYILYIDQGTCMKVWELAIVLLMPKKHCL